MHKTLILCLWLCLLATGLKAAPVELKPLSPVQLKTDSVKITPRSFDLQQIKEYKARKDFIYDDTAPAESLWDRFWRWFWSWIGRFLNNGYTGGWMRYLVIAAAVALLIFVAIKLSGIDLKIFTRKSKAVDVPYTESLDNIHEIDFEQEIDKAIAAGNYRFAVRLFYLYSLKLLNDGALINWQPEKTNQTYVAELADQDRKRQFGQLTIQFEYIWYGEFFIDKENFNQVKISFDQFNQQLR